MTIAIETLKIPECIRGRLTTDIRTAAEVLGIGLNQAYRAAKAGDIPTLRLGGRLVVPVRPLLALLGADDGPRVEQLDAADPDAA